MNAYRSSVKSVLRSLGLFPRARHMYRRLHPRVRAEHRAEIAFYSEFIGAGDLCFDIGANLGQRSEVFREIGARVVAVEPNPLCAPTIRYELGHDCDGFALLHRAVGAISGERVHLNIAGTDSTASVRSDWRYIRPDAAVEVETITLDELIEQHGQPRFVKIDVEGYEEQVLQGLTRPVPLLSFEYHALGSEFSYAARCLERMCQLGASQFRAVPMNCEGWACDWLDAGEFRQFLRSGTCKRSANPVLALAIRSVSLA